MCYNLRVCSERQTFMRGVFRINVLCSARNYSDGIFSCIWLKDKRARTSDLAFSVFVDYSAFRGGGGGGECFSTSKYVHHCLEED